MKDLETAHVLMDWIKFSGDIKPSDFAGEDWLDGLRQRTIKIIGEGVTRPQAPKEYKYQIESHITGEPLPEKNSRNIQYQYGWNDAVDSLATRKVSVEEIEKIVQEVGIADVSGKTTLFCAIKNPKEIAQAIVTYLERGK